ncbi:MAG: aldehyde dehydrogenase family protein [Leptospiraceae bacterium]|nr:aldehyde dehydrogenase family protein [Leptospiraceae bacterium]
MVKKGSVKTKAVAKQVDKTPEIEEEINRVFAGLRQNRWNIANTSASERIDKLKKLRKAIEERVPELKEAMHKDFRKAPHEVEITEIFPTIHEIRTAIAGIRDWMQPKDVSTPLTMFGSTSRVIYEPKGVALIIGPWNYPFQLILAPLVAAIAAGNTVMIRPSNNTKNTSVFIQSLLSSIFPENEVAVMLGDTSMANIILKKPFDHIFFTGSPSVGTTIMEAAAKNLASVTLELGGKSPVIIDETASLDYTSLHTVWGKLLNAGQTCIGVDYVLIHESKIDEFVEKAKSRVKQFYGETADSWKTTPDLCRIINEKNFLRLKGLVEGAIKDGASLELGGEFDANEKYISPTILKNVKLHSDIMQEEIFGPILPLIPYKTLEEAIKVIDSKPKPLALYMFSENESNIQKVLKNTSSGGAVINGALVHFTNPEVPFGGINHSGIGNYHGYFGFKAFSHERALIRVNKLNILHKMYPPYSEFTSKLINFVTRYL